MANPLENNPPIKPDQTPNAPQVPTPKIANAQANTSSAMAAFNMLIQQLTVSMEALKTTPGSEKGLFAQGLKTMPSLSYIKLSPDHVFINPARGAAQTAGVEASATPSSATAMYQATLQLLDSMLVLGSLIKNPPADPTVPAGTPNLNMEIAYTLFADSVVNWQSSYNTFTGNGGQPDAVTAAIETELNQTLPGGGSIYSLSQTVSQNPADWQQLQSGVSTNTLEALGTDVYNWVASDQTAGGVGNPWFLQIGSNGQPTNPNAAFAIAQLNAFDAALKNYNPSVLPTNLDGAAAALIQPLMNIHLTASDGPLCALLVDFAAMPIFSFNGSDQSLEQITTWLENNNAIATPAQLTQILAAFNSSYEVMSAYMALVMVCIG